MEFCTEFPPPFKLSPFWWIFLAECFCRNKKINKNKTPPERKIVKYSEKYSSLPFVLLWLTWLDSVHPSRRLLPLHRCSCSRVQKNTIFFEKKKRGKIN